MAAALIKIGREMEDDLLAGTRRLGMFQGHEVVAKDNSGWWWKTGAIVVAVVLLLVVLFFCGQRWLKGPVPPGSGGGDDASEWRRLYGLCRAETVKASIGNIIASMNGAPQGPVTAATPPQGGQPADSQAGGGQDPNFTPI